MAMLATGGVVITAALFPSGQRSIQINAGPRVDTLGWAIGTSAGIPDDIRVSLAALAAALTVERATPFGKVMKAVGCGEPAARMASIHVRRTRLPAFAPAGSVAALSGVVPAGRLSSGSPIIANEFLLRRSRRRCSAARRWPAPAACLARSSAPSRSP